MPENFSSLELIFLRIRFLAFFSYVSDQRHRDIIFEVVSLPAQVPSIKDTSSIAMSPVKDKPLIPSKVICLTMKESWLVLENPL